MSADIVPAELLEIMQCPRCGAALRTETPPPFLVCTNGHRYPVVDGIPDMVVDDEESE